MKNNKMTLKVFVLSMGMGAAMLTASSSQAQMIEQRGGHRNDMFKENGQNGLMQRGGNRSDGSTVGNEAFGATGSEINNEPFGVPIGGGIGFLLAAGAGYALIQSKKTNRSK